MNVAATVRALETCLAQIDFFACMLFTDVKVHPSHPKIEVVPIPRLVSSNAYSQFLLQQLVDHLATPHCLIVQWDGHVLDASRWRAEFLDYDYIGARWPQFDDGHDVGNGGFSLRSLRLMEACRQPEFVQDNTEDTAIGRTNRTWLECQGMRFAPPALADLFAVERAGDLAVSFGYHGVFNMPRAIGIDNFWKVYLELDDRKTVWHDFRAIAKDIRHGSDGFSRLGRMIIDGLKPSGYRKGDCL
ncbi:peptidoglycan/xylan/chitin deacetylase (PgdA/CDA1 family) [Sphingobium subterraneum]|uniref:Peptidoglycan/xylan/chitin deacetylase (PgdA/CDA1 family) n=1 Tax=Sphingobium subterraneum TaxID=627688 RepID=A0A841IYL2_9SPHN|nr:peptidoglycan/xylan/chitin deacetylase (PgdA/CDA1 family) [Sphingobium subterraneum]